MAARRYQNLSINLIRPAERESWTRQSCPTPHRREMCFMLLCRRMWLQLRLFSTQKKKKSAILNFNRSRFYQRFSTKFCLARYTRLSKIYKSLSLSRISLLISGNLTQNIRLPVVPVLIRRRNIVELCRAYSRLWFLIEVCCSRWVFVFHVAD